MRALLITLVLLLLFLQYRLWFADDGLIQTFRLKKEIREQTAKNEEIKKHNSVLVNEIDALKRSGDAIENRARGDLGMVKKGEVFYQVIK